jgi:hypothetical protein
LGDRLYVGSTALAEASGRQLAFVDPAGSSERMWFERPAGGRPQRLNLSGSIFTRLADG